MISSPSGITTWDGRPTVGAMVRPSALTRAAAVSLALLSAATLSACGSSSSTGAAPSTTAATGVSTDAVKGTASNDPFCVQVGEAAKNLGLNSASANGIEDAMSKLPEAAKVLEEASASAPSEIKSDLQVLSATLAEIGPAMAEMAKLSTAAGSDPTKAAEVQAASAEFTKKMASLQDPKVTAAIDHLNTYAKEKCGVSFS